MARHLAELSVRPIGGVRLLRNLIARQVLVIDFLLEFAVGADGTHFHRFAGRVVIGFDGSSESVFFDDGVLGEHGGRISDQSQTDERPSQAQKHCVSLSRRALIPCAELEKLTLIHAGIRSVSRVLFVASYRWLCRFIGCGASIAVTNSLTPKYRLFQTGLARKIRCIIVATLRH